MADETKAQSDGNREGLVPEADEILGAETSEAPEMPDTGDEAASLRKENEELKANYLRAVADAENVRRRAQRDVVDARQYAVTSFARDLLTVVDNFDRAMAAAQTYHAEELSPELHGLVEGVKMTERELHTVLERHGVAFVNPEGERFDPNKHQAMFEIENTEVASGTVVQVMQPGATLNDRVLRPALVGVSKGGPKAQPAGAGDGGNGEAAPGSDAGAASEETTG